MNSRRFARLTAEALLLAATVTAAAACTDRPNFTGALEGMRGTTAAEVVNTEFLARLTATPAGVDLVDTDFAAESYDAVVILALAAEAAQSDGGGLAKHIVEVTRSGVSCDSFAQCVAAVRSGTDIAYVGATGPRPLNDLGEPETANFQLEAFGSDDRLDDTQRIFLKGVVPPSMTAEAPAIDSDRVGDGELHLGALLPITGRGSIFVAPMQAGIDLAVQDINDAGGVLGKPVRLTALDSGDDSSDLPTKSASSLLAANVDAIVGPSLSAITLQIIDQVTAAGVPLFSPTNTATSLTHYPDRGLYFRNLPSDVIQGETLATAVAGEGHRTVAILAVNDAYGNGIADQLREAFARLGVQVVIDTRFDPTLPQFFREAIAVRDARPDAVIVVATTEASRLLRALVISGVGPRKVPTFGADGVMSNVTGQRFDSGQ